MSWTYRCLSPKCKCVYTQERPSTPKCPKCRSPRARWVPQHVAIGKSAAGIDRELRTIATQYGLSDLRSAKAGEPAVPRRASANAHGSFDYKPAAGLSSMKVNTDAAGMPLPTAGWTGDKIKFSPNDVTRHQTNPALGLANNTQVVHRDNRAIPR